MAIEINRDLLRLPAQELDDMALSKARSYLERFRGDRPPIAEELPTVEGSPSPAPEPEPAGMEAAEETGTERDRDILLQVRKSLARQKELRDRGAR